MERLHYEAHHHAHCSCHLSPHYVSKLVRQVTLCASMHDMTLHSCTWQLPTTSLMNPASGPALKAVRLHVAACALLHDALTQASLVSVSLKVLSARSAGWPWASAGHATCAALDSLQGLESPHTAISQHLTCPEAQLCALLNLLWAARHVLLRYPSTLPCSPVPTQA